MRPLFSLERQRLPARKSLFEAVPVSDFVLSEVPAEEHGVSLPGMLRGKIDQALVEILDLDAHRLELGDEARNVGGRFSHPLLKLADPLRVETAPVSRHATFDIFELSGHVHEALADLHEALDERPDGLECRVRLFLGEEPHPAMLNSAVA
jgi:hypothetical protein